MASVETAKPAAVTPERAPVTRYGVFAVTFGVIFAVAYVLIMAKSWQLFTYYPASGQWTFLSHKAAGAAPGPGMKWYGYVAMSGLVALAAGLVVAVAPHKRITQLWWAGLIWLAPIVAMAAVAYLIVFLGD